MIWKGSTYKKIINLIKEDKAEELERLLLNDQCAQRVADERYADIVGELKSLSPKPLYFLFSFFIKKSSPAANPLSGLKNSLSQLDASHRCLIFDSAILSEIFRLYNPQFEAEEWEKLIELYDALFIDVTKKLEILKSFVKLLPFLTAGLLEFNKQWKDPSKSVYTLSLVIEGIVENIDEPGLSEFLPTLKSILCIFPSPASHYRSDLSFEAEIFMKILNLPASYLSLLTSLENWDFTLPLSCLPALNKLPNISEILREIFNSYPNSREVLLSTLERVVKRIKKGKTDLLDDAIKFINLIGPYFSEEELEHFFLVSDYNAMEGFFKYMMDNAYYKDKSWFVKKYPLIIKVLTCFLQESKKSEEISKPLYNSIYYLLQILLPNNTILSKPGDHSCFKISAPKIEQLEKVIDSFLPVNRACDIAVKQGFRYEELKEKLDSLDGNNFNIVFKMQIFPQVKVMRSKIIVRLLKNIPTDKFDEENIISLLSYIELDKLTNSGKKIILGLIWTFSHIEISKALESYFKENTLKWLEVLHSSLQSDQSTDLYKNASKILKIRNWFSKASDQNSETWLRFLLRAVKCADKKNVTYLIDNGAQSYSLNQASRFLLVDMFKLLNEQYRTPKSKIFANSIFQDCLNAPGFGEVFTKYAAYYFAGLNSDDTEESNSLLTLNILLYYAEKSNYNFQEFYSEFGLKASPEYVDMELTRGHQRNPFFLMLMKNFMEDNFFIKFTLSLNDKLSILRFHISAKHPTDRQKLIILELVCHIDNFASEEVNFFSDYYEKLQEILYFSLNSDRSTALYRQALHVLSLFVNDSNRITFLFSKQSDKGKGWWDFLVQAVTHNNDKNVNSLLQYAQYYLPKESGKSLFVAALKTFKKPGAFEEVSRRNCLNIFQKCLAVSVLRKSFLKEALFYFLGLGEINSSLPPKTGTKLFFQYYDFESQHKKISVHLSKMNGYFLNIIMQTIKNNILPKSTEKEEICSELHEVLNILVYNTQSLVKCSDAFFQLKPFIANFCGEGFPNPLKLTLQDIETNLFSLFIDFSKEKLNLLSNVAKYLQLSKETFQKFISILNHKNSKVCQDICSELNITFEEYRIPYKSVNQTKDNTPYDFVSLSKEWIGSTAVSDTNPPQDKVENVSPLDLPTESGVPQVRTSTSLNAEVGVSPT